MVLTIHQPSFFPWLGLLDKIAKSTDFMFLTTVPASKGSYQYRNQLLCNGKKHWITIPVALRLGELLCNLEVKESNNWKRSHLDKITNYYRRTPAFEEVFYDIEQIYAKCDETKVIDLIKDTMTYCLRVLGIEVILHDSRDGEYFGQKGELILDINKKLSSGVYLSGRGGEYIRPMLKEFAKFDIKVEFQEFNHPIYRQLGSNSFVPGLSSLDLFFNVGKTEARKIFWENVKK